jgi:hypothetical protein
MSRDTIPLKLTNGTLLRHSNIGTFLLLIHALLEWGNQVKPLELGRKNLRRVKWKTLVRLRLQAYSGYAYPKNLSAHLRRQCKRDGLDIVSCLKIGQLFDRAFLKMTVSIVSYVLAPLLRLFIT